MGRVSGFPGLGTPPGIIIASLLNSHGNVSAASVGNSLRDFPGITRVEQGL